MPRQRRKKYPQDQQTPAIPSLPLQGSYSSVDWTQVPVDVHYLLLHYMPMQTLFTVCCLVCKSWRNYIMSSADSIDQNMLWYHLSKQRFGVHDYTLQQQQQQQQQQQEEEMSLRRTADYGDHDTGGSYSSEGWRRSVDWGQLQRRQHEIGDRVRLRVNWKHYFVIQYMFEKHHSQDVARSLEYDVSQSGNGGNGHGRHNSTASLVSARSTLAAGLNGETDDSFHMTQIFSADNRPRKIHRHTMSTCYVRDPVGADQRRPLLVVIGNYKDNDDRDAVYDAMHPIVHTYNLDTRKFTQLFATGQGPDPTLWRHSACVFDHSKIAVFGGSRDRKEKINDLYILDVERKHWLYVDAQNRPSPRSDHAAASVQDRWIYVFGGSNLDVMPMNDLHCFDLQTMQWSGELQINGPKPPPRSGSQIVYMSNSHQLCMFGGGVWSRVHWSQKHNDVWMFDINSGTWLLIEVHGKHPEAGTFPGVVPIDHFLFVMGGGGSVHVVDEVLVFNTITQRWIPINSLSSHVACDGPGVCSVLEEEVGDNRDPEKSNCLYVFGGYAGRALDHFFLITMQWRSKALRVLRTLEPRD